MHHGNGTQAIFWDDPRVLYVSTHQWPLYPGTGRASETGGPGAPGLTVNVPVPPRTTGDVILQALDEVVSPAVDRFAPTWVLASAGYDAHRADPMAGLELTSGDFADIAMRVKAFAPATGRLAFILEGGYDLDALRLSVGASLGAVLDVEFRPEHVSSGGPGDDAVDAARRGRNQRPPLTPPVRHGRWESYPLHPGGVDGLLRQLDDGAPARPHRFDGGTAATDSPGPRHSPAHAVDPFGEQHRHVAACG